MSPLSSLLLVIGGAAFLGKGASDDGQRSAGQSSGSASPPTKPEIDQRLSSLRGKRVEVPVSGTISGILGDARSHGPHQGIDIAAAAGTPVKAYGDGVVARVIDGRKSSSDSKLRAGLWIDIFGDDGNTHRYLHLGQALVNPGQRVKRLQQIGTVEKDHLHFEVRKGRSAYGNPDTPTV